MNVKLKNRVYTIIGALGVLYLGYLAIRFIRLGAWTRGLLFLLVFVILTYFTVLNIIYYFTTKTAKFDISPKIEKLLGGRPAGAADDPMVGSKHAGQAAQIVPAAGLFHEQSLLPTKVVTDSVQEEHIKQLVDDLIASDYWQLDYAGRSEREIYRLAKNSGQPVYALSQAAPLPFYELREQAGHYLVYGGRNAIDSLALGEVTEVGLMPIAQAAAKYRIVLANVQLTGGPYKLAGRSGLVSGNGDFQITAKAAYKAPQKPEQTTTDLETKRTQTATPHLSRTQRHRNE